MGPQLIHGGDAFVDGAWLTSSTGEHDDVLNPATGATLARVGRGGPSEADQAIAAARAAFDDGRWSGLRGAERGAHLRRLQEALAKRAEALVELVVAEVGTPVAAARGHQVGLPIEHLEYWAEVAARPELVAHPPRLVRRSDGSSWLGSWVVRREPAGVVAAITAYNFPFLLTMMKLGPALAAGNTVIVKPSPLTPLTVLALAAAAEEADLPPGVLNVLTGGDDVGTLLTTDPRVDLVSFTGSDRVGAAIAGQAAPTLKRVILELGGKSALIVRADADLDLAVEQAVRGFTFNAGQGCALTTRLLVHRDRHDEFSERVTGAAARVRVGDPADPATHMGPLIRPVAVERSLGYVEQAVAAGATVLAGGRVPDGLGDGFFLEPTVVGGVQSAWPIAQDEIFGPVAVILPFADDDEAVAIANDSRFGLDGAVVSEDAGAAFDLACRLRTGGVAINGGAGYTSPDVPFGGYKRSGLGRENGEAGLDEYTQLKTIKYHGR